MRIQRALARAGIASRRKAELLVAAGRVRVNGAIARTGQTVDPVADELTVDGRRVAPPAPPRWLILHKPSGVLTTHTDSRGRRTVFDLLPGVPGLTYVGRLDYLTEGLLLLTTDGDAAHALTHPATEVERTYVATVRGNAPAAVRLASRGVTLDGAILRPEHVQARALGDRTWAFEVTIREGRNRAIRRLCDALGLEVLRLVRTRYGPIELGSLEPGASRPLTARERAAVEALVKGGG